MSGYSTGSVTHGTYGMGKFSDRVARRKHERKEAKARKKGKVV